jgi:hypothetical protein
MAVVHGEEPEVFLAEDIDVLHWVLALEWVARADPQLVPGIVDSLRQALLEERWADAVVSYMEHLGTKVDVFTGEVVHDARKVALGAAELQFRPLFRD